MSRLLTLAFVVLLPAAVRAAGVAVYNSSDRPVAFAVGHAGTAVRNYTLAAGESRLVPVGRKPDIAFTAGKKAVRFRLEPFHAYMFSAEKGTVEFHGIDLAAAMPPADDVPAEPPPPTPLKLPVALFADDANTRTRAGWEAAYRGRLAAASEILTRQCGVTLTVASVGDWKSDPSHADLLQQLGVFERAAPVPPGTLAVGYLSRHPKPDPENKEEPPAGFGRGPLWPHLLLRDGKLRTEGEKVEALLREVAHHLGAAHTPDPLSAMREKLSAGRGASTRYPLGLDPLNLLAVGIWADELRAGKPRSVADLRPVNRERLTVVYKTLSGLLPADELAAELLAAIERAAPAAEAPPAVKEPAPKPEMPRPAPPAAVAAKPVPPVVTPPADQSPPLDRAGAVRKVVQAVRLRAVDLHREPEADRAKGDALTVELLMAAGDVAFKLPDPLKAPAFAVGIGIALDDSDVLRTNFLVGGTVKAAETDAERAERRAALGTPTLRGRRDLLQHFVVSAALAELIGPAKAESVGLLKELADRDGVSGFSFADLAADVAGIQLTQALTKYPPAVGRFRDGVSLNDYMPDIGGLKEGLTAAKFAGQYGDLQDPRFQAELAAVRKRVTDLPKYREISEFTAPKK